MSDQLDAETSTCQYKTLTRDRHPCPRRDSKPQFLQASCRKTQALDRAATGIGSVYAGS